MVIGCYYSLLLQLDMMHQVYLEIDFRMCGLFGLGIVSICNFNLHSIYISLRFKLVSICKSIFITQPTFLLPLYSVAAYFKENMLLFESWWYIRNKIRHLKMKCFYNGGIVKQLIYVFLLQHLVVQLHIYLEKGKTNNKSFTSNISVQP